MGGPTALAQTTPVIGAEAAARLGAAAEAAVGEAPAAGGEGQAQAAPAAGEPQAAAIAPDDSAGQGDIDATTRAYGAFQRGYYLTAMDLALGRAQLGDPVAQTLVAELFAEGLGVARDMDDAAFWYKQAAEAGDAAAQFKYAIMLLEGKYVPRDSARSAELMTKAADAGNAFAQFNHAQSLVAAKPGPNGIRQALPYFEKSAEQGVADAQYALALIYNNTDGIPEDKRAAARDWLAKAARAGYDTAQLDLAIWLIDGIGGAKDYEQGFRWMQVAAAGGNVVAQNRLAVLYINAIGTRGDPVTAAKWYIVSKRAGYNDRDLDDFYQGLTSEEQKAAIDAANKFTPQ
ncbi:tetratricopeptide repeat protein [Hoeflea marina]